MVRAYLDYDGTKWREVPKSDFWLDKLLYEKLVNLKKIQAKEWDGVILVDGKERSGKSILGMACGWFLSDKKLTANNFATGLSDAAKKIAELPDKSVIILDEGSLIFSSKDYASKAQKKLIKILDVVGQKNLIFIICLPCFFDLNKTIAVRRSLFLMHVYPDKNYNRGSYAFWGEKAKGKLYTIGKKNYDSYAFPRAEFVGSFPHFKPPFYDDYLEKVKKASLKEALDGSGNKPPTKIMLAYGRAANFCRKEGWTWDKIAKMFNLSRQVIIESERMFQKDIEDNQIVSNSRGVSLSKDGWNPTNETPKEKINSTEEEE